MIRHFRFIKKKKNKVRLSENVLNEEKSNASQIIFELIKTIKENKRIDRNEKRAKKEHKKHKRHKYAKQLKMVHLNL